MFSEGQSICILTALWSHQIVWACSSLPSFLDYELRKMLCKNKSLIPQSKRYSWSEQFQIVFQWGSHPWILDIIFLIIRDIGLLSDYWFYTQDLLRPDSPRPIHTHTHNAFPVSKVLVFFGSHPGLGEDRRTMASWGMDATRDHWCLKSWPAHRT